MTFATLRARFDTEFVMYRNFSFAAALLAAAFSGPALAEGINSFLRQKRRASKLTPMRRAISTAVVKLTGKAKRVVDLESCGYKVRKMKTAPVELNGSTLSPPGSLVISASAGRTVGVKLR